MPSEQTGASDIAGFARKEEREIARYLDAVGRQVRPNPVEGASGMGRQGDAFVDGVLHEFKTLEPGATSATIKKVVNDSIRRGGQARYIVIDARATGLGRTEAQRGIFRALGVARGLLDRVTVIGDGYFIGYGPR